MAKQLKDVLAGVKASKRIKTVLGKDPGVDYRPKAKDEADWADKHEIERHEDRVGNGDDVYQAKNVKYSLASPKEDKHGMERPKDKKVYEAKETEEATCNESPAGKMCPVHGIKECSYTSRLREDEKYIGLTKLKRKLVNERVLNPYAVGMSAAMKATGDKPPLKKSTIVKAHKIAKGIKNEDLAVPLLGSHDSDEAVDMLKTELKALANKAMHLVMAMPDGMHVEPWVQSKIAQAKEMVSSVHDYMVYGDHDKEEKEQTAPYEGGIDPLSGNVRNTYPNFSADVNTGRNV